MWDIRYNYTCIFLSPMKKLIGNEYFVISSCFLSFMFSEVNWKPQSQTFFCFGNLKLKLFCFWFQKWKIFDALVFHFSTNPPPKMLLKAEFCACGNFCLIKKPKHFSLNKTFWCQIFGQHGSLPLIYNWWKGPASMRENFSDIKTKQKTS